jgi:hypothetical protein
MRKHDVIGGKLKHIFANGRSTIATAQYHSFYAFLLKAQCCCGLFLFLEQSREKYVIGIM